MLKGLIVFLLFLTNTMAFGSEPSNAVDVINGSCTEWDPGYQANCQTCPKKVNNKCVGGGSCNEWARGACSGWKKWCNKFVLKAPGKGEQLGSEYRDDVVKCRLYARGSIKFRTYLEDFTPESNTKITPGAGTSGSGSDSKDPQHVSGVSGTVSGTPGFSNFGEFCDRSKEWCGEKTPTDQIEEHLATKELKKFLYAKGVERLIEGMKKFEADVSMGGAPGTKPSDRLIDQACCGDLKTDDAAGCLENTSYGNGTLAQDSGLNQDWAPEFCKGRTTSCQDGRKDSEAANNMNVNQLTEKLLKYSNELKSHMDHMGSVYGDLPLDLRMAQSPECSEPMNPADVKTGNSKCVTKYLSLSQTAAAIRSKKINLPAAQKFLNHFEEYSARHRLMGTVPYVLLLTGNLRDIYSGKNAKDIASLKSAAGKMAVNSEVTRRALKDFSGDVGSKALCSMKRLYSGRVKGNEDLNGLDDCTAGSDENRAILASILKNPGLFEEIVTTGKGLPPSLTLGQVDRIACGIQRKTESCQAMWKSWEPYTKTLKGGMSLAKYPLTLVAPYIAVPYFYADQAIEVATALSDMDKASIREDQILASVLKDEMGEEEFMVELNEREEVISKAKLGMMFAAAGLIPDVFDISKVFYVKILGSKANELTLLKLFEEGDDVAVKNFLKNNPKVKVVVSDKPPKKKKKKSKKSKKK